MIEGCAAGEEFLRISDFLLNLLWAYAHNI